jgi:serine/threonine-protein kinase
MADVYLADDIDLQRRVVLKIMLPHLAQDKAFVARFQREAQITARLNHPNIVQVYSTGFTAHERPYLAMQYVQGGSLQDRVIQLAGQGKLFSTVAALTIGRQMADALHMAHQAGIIHRDLKPSNILLHPNGTPVLSDLGIASVEASTRLTHTGELMGTPHYMSPEQAAGKPIDGRSDIYSLGIILHELLTGEVPFQAESPLAVLHQHIYEPPPPLAKIRPDLAPLTHQIVATCLQKDPAARFPDAAALLVALDQALAAEGAWQQLPASETGRPAVWRPAVWQQFIRRSQVVRTLTALYHHGRLSRWFYGVIPLLLLLLVGGVFVWPRPARFASAPLPTATTLVSSTDPTSEVVAVAGEPTSTLAPTATAVPPTSTPTSSPTSTAEPVPTVAPTDIPRRNQIVFQSSRDGDFEIFIMNADGSNQQQLTFNEVDDNFPVVSLDGQKVLFESERDGNWEVYAMDIDGHNQQRLTDHPDNDRLPTWSPDGRQVAFISDRDGNYNLYIMDGDGQNLRQVTFATLRTGHVSWSVDNRLAFNTGTMSGSTWEIYTIDVDGGNQRQLTSNSVSDWSPEWSPDGRFILYLSLVNDTDPAVFVMNADGSNQRLLFNSPDYEWGSHWSADGTRVVFTREQDNISYIYVINADGSGLTQLTARGSYPSWVR